MPHTSTFLRFTTRGLLLLTLGLSVILGTAFSLLPPLLGITRHTLAIGMGAYLGGFGLGIVAMFVKQHQLDQKSGECLFQYPSSLPRTWVGVGCLLFLGSGILFVESWRHVLAEGGVEFSFLWSGLAGLVGSAGLMFLLLGRSKASVEFREHGVVAPDHGFVPWFLVRARQTQSPNVVELWLRAEQVRLELSEAERKAIESILVQYLPGYSNSATSGTPLV